MPKIMFSNPKVQEVFDSHKCSHEEFKQLLLDRARGVQEVSAKEADAKIRQIFCEVCGVDEKSKKNEIRKAVRRHQMDIFEIIEEVLPVLLQSGWQSNPFFNEFVEYRNLNEGDTNEFVTLDNTVLNVSRVSGGHWDIKRQRLGEGERFGIEVETYAVAIYAEFERLLAGYEDWSYLVSKVNEAFTKKINDALYAATIDATANIPNATQFAKTLDFSAADASREDLISLVEDVQTATGKEVVIMGTKSALAKLRKLAEVDWISANMKEELYTTGRLGLFMGIRLVEIPQVFKPNTTERMIDPTGTSLMIMPVDSQNKFIKFVTEGDAMIKEVTDPTVNLDMTSEYYFIQKFGIATVFGLQFGTVTIQNT